MTKYWLNGRWLLNSIYHQQKFDCTVKASFKDCHKIKTHLIIETSFLVLLHIGGRIIEVLVYFKIFLYLPASASGIVIPLKNWLKEYIIVTIVEWYVGWLVRVTKFVKQTTSTVFLWIPMKLNKVWFPCKCVIYVCCLVLSYMALGIRGHWWLCVGVFLDNSRFMKSQGKAVIIPLTNIVLGAI